MRGSDARTSQHGSTLTRELLYIDHVANSTKALYLTMNCRLFCSLLLDFVAVFTQCPRRITCKALLMEYIDLICCNRKYVSDLAPFHNHVGKAGYDAGAHEELESGDIKDVDLREVDLHSPPELAIHPMQDLLLNSPLHSATHMPHALAFDPSHTIADLTPAFLNAAQQDATQRNATLGKDV